MPVSEELQQPQLAMLMSRYLLQSDSEEFASAAVEPHEVMGAFRCSASQAWSDAQAVFRMFGVKPEKMSLPPEWAAYVASDIPRSYIPWAVGMIPQRVRDLTALFNTPPRLQFTPLSGFSTLRQWAKNATTANLPGIMLIATGIAAELGEWSLVEQGLGNAEPLCTGSWRAIWENQNSSLNWLHSGTRSTTLTTDFNRGLAELIAGNYSAAHQALSHAATELPSESGWPHLANLYASVALHRG